MGDLVWPVSLCLDVPSPGSCVSEVSFLFIRLINLLIFPCGSGRAASFLPLPSPGAAFLSTNMWHEYTQSNLVLGSWAMYICQPNFTMCLSLLSPLTGSVSSMAISLETQRIVFSFLINLPQLCFLTGLHVLSIILRVFWLSLFGLEQKMVHIYDYPYNYLASDKLRRFSSPCSIFIPKWFIIFITFLKSILKLYPEASSLCIILLPCKVPFPYSCVSVQLT